MVSCLASRSGTKSDSFAIDYQATLNCLEAAKKEGAKHFVMLSAFCVKKPILQVIVGMQPLGASSLVLVGCGVVSKVHYKTTNGTAVQNFRNRRMLPA